MSALLMLIALIPMGVAAHQFWTAVGQVEPTLPVQFRDNGLARVAIDTYVWNRSIPVSARRRYLRFLFCLSIALALFAAAQFVADQMVPALLFGGLSAANLIYASIRLVRYRALL